MNSVKLLFRYRSLYYRSFHSNSLKVIGTKSDRNDSDFKVTISFIIFSFFNGLVCHLWKYIILKKEMLQYFLYPFIIFKKLKKNYRHFSSVGI